MLIALRVKPDQPPRDVGLRRRARDAMIVHGPTGELRLVSLQLWSPRREAGQCPTRGMRPFLGWHVGQYSGPSSPRRRGSCAAVRWFLRYFQAGGTNSGLLRWLQPLPSVMIDVLRALPDRETLRKPTAEG